MELVLNRLNMRLASLKSSGFKITRLIFSPYFYINVKYCMLSTYNINLGKELTHYKGIPVVLASEDDDKTKDYFIVVE